VFTFPQPAIVTNSVVAVKWEEQRMRDKEEPGINDKGRKVEPTIDSCNRLLFSAAYPLVRLLY